MTYFFGEITMKPLNIARMLFVALGLTATVALVLTSCGAAPVLIGSERISLQDTSTTAPIVLTTGEVKRDYEEMALISAYRFSFYSPGTTQQVNEILREKAREMGANAVVRIQYYYVGHNGYLHALGTAVKYK
jgi:hypothetical protein